MGVVKALKKLSVVFSHSWMGRMLHQDRVGSPADLLTA